jgi:hypothetical protein
LIIGTSTPLTFSFSFNLAGLPQGQHSVDVYAEGFVIVNGVGMRVGTLLSNTVCFTVSGESSPSPSPAPSPSPTTTPNIVQQQTGLVEIVLAVALIVIVVGAGLGLLVHLIRRE